MDFSYLDPTKTHIERSPDGTVRMVVTDDVCAMQVEAFRALPLSAPDDHIVLRDGGGREVGVLHHLSDLNDAAQSLVREQLRRRYFMPQIIAIVDVTERFGSTEWDVDTDRGRRMVSMRQINEAITEVTPGRYLLTDVEGNRYEIKNLDDLDPESRARFFGKM